MFRVITKLSFLIGVSIGVFLAILIKCGHKNAAEKDAITVQRPFQHSNSYEKRFKLSRRRVSFDSARYGNASYTFESSFLYDKITVFCLVLVKNGQNAKAVRDTWGRHCNRVDLLSIKSEKKVPILKRSKEESSWVLLCKRLKQVPENYKWVLIVYDYTFVLVENLRLFLASLNHDKQYYLGHAVKFWSTVYNMGQAGYVLSKGSLDKLKEKLDSADSCTRTLTYRNQEDYYLGKSLGSLNITPVDTRDADNLSTFHPYNLNQVFFPGENYYKFSIFPHKCCSRFSVTFQAIEGSKMYTYYYLLYTLQLFHDGHLGNKQASKTVKDDEVWRAFLKSRNISTNISSEEYYKIWSEIVQDPATFNKKMLEEEHVDTL